MLANHLGPSWRHAIVAMDGVTTARERLDADLDVEFPFVESRRGDLRGNVQRFRSLLRTLQPRTLLTHNFGSIEWAMANRLSLARHVHVEDGFGPDERDRQLRRRVWLRRVFLRGRTVVLPSQNLLRVARDVWRLNPGHLHYVPNGIDLARFAGPVRWPDWPGDGPVIGTVAALRPEKNIARLIRSFAAANRHVPARLVLIGDGPERGELERLAGAEALGDRIHFLGHIRLPAELIKAFKIFAMSSDTEQMPISLLEAMAAGLPAVATDVGDIRAMLPEINRPFVTACDDTALSSAMLTLLEQPSLRLALGTAARQKAFNDYGQDRMFARWSALLEGETHRFDG